MRIMPLTKTLSISRLRPHARFAWRRFEKLILRDGNNTAAAVNLLFLLDSVVEKTKNSDEKIHGNLLSEDNKKAPAGLRDPQKHH